VIEIAFDRFSYVVGFFTTFPLCLCRDELVDYGFYYMV
jgi:hypothetical protein